jgi:hypothetical protein
VTKTVDSLQKLNKKLPAGEGADCRQMKPGSSSNTRPQLVRSPFRNASPRWRWSMGKSGLLQIGYPALQNICHVVVGGARFVGERAVPLFNIMSHLRRPDALLPARSSLRCIFWGSTDVQLLMDRRISVPSVGRTLFPRRGLPTGPNPLFI